VLAHRFGIAFLFLFAVAPLFFSQAPSTSSSRAVFTDVAQQGGITWTHFSGASPDRFLIETMGGGVGFLDFDHDGLQDMFFVNGGETPNGKSPKPVRNALYRNLGNGEFQDVSAHAGIDSPNSYGMGVAVADFDNDGLPDLFITGYPECALLHNNGNGTFTDVTARAGVKNSGRWAAGAAWFDYDRDGLLDLIVTNYVEFSFDQPKKCEVNGERSYCAQVAYKGMPLTLYHNDNDGTFTDVSARSGLNKMIGRGLGVVAIDFNDDGWPDLFIARDASPNLLLINKRDGTFQDAALDAEVAYDPNGNAKAGMGIDAADVNGDGIPDLVVTNFNDQYHSLFMGSASFPYQDQTIASHLAQFSKADVGWGTKFLDYDNDGNPDLIIANGHINQSIELMRGDVKYQQPLLLLHNEGQGVLRNAAQEGGPAFSSGYIARGLAVGDFDNDGDPDVVITRLNGTPLLLRNNVGQDSGWVGFELQGSKSNRDAIGAKITVAAGTRHLIRWIVGGSSYISSSDKRVLVGLGHSNTETVDVEVLWPSGVRQKLSNLRVNRYLKIVEGTQ
jgi:enediyne biosynthesis protein E4